MFYFLRIFTVFLVVFVGMALAMDYFFVPQKYAKDDDLRMPASMSMVMADVMTKPRDTYTGLLLAGTSAQNNRDWVAARENFDKLSEKYAAGSSHLLRAMTLSIGAGDFDNALKSAHQIQDEYFTEETAESKQEPFDLVRLLLIAESFKTQDYDSVQAIMDDLNGGALSQFAKPIIEMWMAAETGVPIKDAQSDHLSKLQLIYAAMAAEYAGEITKAKRLFESIPANTMTGKTIETLAAFYVRQKNEAKAIKVLKQGVQKFPDNEYIAQSLRQLETDDEDYVPPMFTSTHMQGSTSGMALAFADFARLMANERAIDSALLFARLATYLDPELPSIRMVIGDILSLQEQFDKALIAYKEVKPNDPDYIAAQVEMAEILNDKGMAEDAIEQLTQVIAQRPDDAKASLYLTLANLYKSDRQYDKAIGAYDVAEAKALEEGNGQAPDWMWFLHYFRGVTFDVLDRHAEAEVDLKKALELEPENATLLNYLGYSYADKGQNIEAAYDMIARAVEQKPNDAYIVDSMGWVLYRMGRYDEAVEHLEYAASLRPYNSVINDHLGDAYWKVGRRLEATYMWQRAVDYIPDNTVENLDADDDEQAKAAARAAEKLKNGLVD